MVPPYHGTRTGPNRVHAARSPLRHSPLVASRISLQIASTSDPTASGDKSPSWIISGYKSRTMVAVVVDVKAERRRASKKCSVGMLYRRQIFLWVPRFGWIDAHERSGSWFPLQS
jgi:hypothetical protein